MFADPQSFTINAVVVSTPRIQSDGGVSVYTSVDGNVVFQVKQSQSATRFRREARLTIKKVATDPISAVNKEVSTSCYFVIDEPKWGFNDTELTDYKEALRNWITSGNIAKVLGGEI